MLVESHTPTLIAEGTRVQGAVVMVSAAGVYGTVEGEVVQQSLEVLQIGRTGWVNGAISSQGPVVIEGKVDGDITSTTRITLSSTASVKGKLNAPSIQIRAGAIFEGELVMRKAEIEKGKERDLKAEFRAETKAEAKAETKTHRTKKAA